MKKAYINPDVKVIKMKSRAQIMAGSVTGDKVYSTAVGGEGLARELDDFWDEEE